MLEHGLPDRLAPLVTATGTSARMLLYHFGTRDALLAEVLRTARARQQELYAGLLLARGDEPYAVTLRRAWDAIAGAGGRPYLRLFALWRAAPAQQPWPDRRRATTDWLEPLERGLATLNRPELATLVLAVFRGLLMDLDATDDVPRTSEAFDHLLDLLDVG